MIFHYKAKVYCSGDHSPYVMDKTICLSSLEYHRIENVFGLYASRDPL